MLMTSWTDVELKPSRDSCATAVGIGESMLPNVNEGP